MVSTTFTKCLNQESKYYGMKLFGLIFGFIFGAVVLIKFTFTFAIMASVVGFILGSFFSGYWHKGHIQRWCYWNLPTKLIANKALPDSSLRKLL